MNRKQIRRLAELSRAMTERDLEEDEQREYDELLALSEERDDEDDDEAGGSRTVGDMDAAEFMQGIASAVGEAVKPLTDESKRSGKGAARRDKLAYGRAGRTEPSPLQRGRYAALHREKPELEHIRTAENDVHVARWYAAMCAGNERALEHLRSQAPELYLEARDMQSDDDWERAFDTGTLNAAGALVPSPLSDAISINRSYNEVIGPRAVQFSNEAGNVQVNKEGVKITVFGKAENNPATESFPTYPPLNLKCRTAIGLVKSSRENESDSAYDLVSNLSSQAGRAFAEYNDAQDTVGGGTSPNTDPLFTNTQINTDAVNVAGPVTTALLYSLYFGLSPGWRVDADWYASGAILESLSGLTWPNGGGQVLNTGESAAPVTGGQGAPAVGTILRRPVYEAVGAPSDELIFGSVAGGFAVLTKGGMLVEATQSGGASFENHQTFWKFVQRRDSGVIHDGAAGGNNRPAFKKAIGIT